MLIYQEILKKRKERTYFHDLPKSKDMKGNILTVGKVVKKREVVILVGNLMDEDELDLYKKVYTILAYEPDRVKFNKKEENIIFKKTLQDEEFKRIIRHVKRIEIETNLDVIYGWVESIKRDVELAGKITDVRGKSVIELDDGINDIQCIVDTESVEEGKIYEVELTKNTFNSERYLVINEDMKVTYGVDNIKEI